MNAPTAFARHTLADAERELNAAGDKADALFFIWKRDRTHSAELAWHHAWVSESKAKQAVDEIEGSR